MRTIRNHCVFKFHYYDIAPKTKQKTIWSASFEVVTHVMCPIRQSVFFFKFFLVFNKKTNQNNSSRDLTLIWGFYSHVICLIRKIVDLCDFKIIEFLQFLNFFIFPTFQKNKKVFWIGTYPSYVSKPKKGQACNVWEHYSTCHDNVIIRFVPFYYIKLDLYYILFVHLLTRRRTHVWPTFSCSHTLRACLKMTLSLFNICVFNFWLFNFSQLNKKQPGTYPRLRFYDHVNLIRNGWRQFKNYPAISLPCLFHPYNM